MIRYNGFMQLLEMQYENRPDAPALIFRSGDQVHVLTYEQLYRQTVSRSEALRSGRHSCMGILCDGSAECVLTIFASVLSGMQTVLLDENAPEELLREQIRHTDVDVLWGEEELKETLASSLTQGPSVHGRRHILFFTSGTTSAGKAVVLTDHSLMSSAYNGSCMLPLSENDRLLCILPLHHVFGFVCSLLWGLQCGACVALGGGMRHLCDDPVFFKPTVISLVPALLGFLLRQKSLGGTVRQVLIGAGDCPASLLHAVQALGIHVSFGYGLTETSSGIAISVSSDPYAMEICPDVTITLGPDGEILVRSPACMMQGYYKDPAQTSRVLCDGILYTGDLGRLDEDGKLHITGRKKEILVLPDGTKIFLPEYEGRIGAALGTSDLAVVRQKNAPVLVIHDDHLTRGQIQELLAPVMAAYPRGQQIRDILFLPDPLPRTATGKIQRWELQRSLPEESSASVL